MDRDNLLLKTSFLIDMSNPGPACEWVKTHY